MVFMFFHQKLESGALFVDLTLLLKYYYNLFTLTFHGTVILSEHV